VIPLIHEPMSFEDLISKAGKFQHRLLFHERTRGNSENVDCSENNKNMLLVFGPEGGFTDYESGMFREHRFEFISLGSRILRAETAIISGTAIIQHRFGDLN